jgi:hypothetical protein
LVANFGLKEAFVARFNCDAGLRGSSSACPRQARCARRQLAADPISSSRPLQPARRCLLRQLVAEEKYVVGEHASERLDERGLVEWQVVAGLEHGALIAERLDATPNPAVEVREALPDGT